MHRLFALQPCQFSWGEVEIYVHRRKPASSNEPGRDCANTEPAVVVKQTREEGGGEEREDASGAHASGATQTHPSDVAT